MTSMRTRWAAVGAAVAVTLGAGGVSLGQAAIGSGDKPVFVGIEPCRLVDTRPGDVNIGGRTVPLGANDTLTLQVTGSTGECTDIPADATAAAMNVTAIQGSTRSYLSIYPTDAALPNASNLNWNGGDPPTPNKVDVALSATGAVNLTNNAGTVHVAADLVGYYIDHIHDDRYYTKSQVDSKLAPSSIMLTPGDLRGSGLWTENGLGISRSGGANTCAYAPVSIPAGRMIASFDIRYVAQAVGVEVRLRQDEFAEGFSNSLDYITTGPTTLDGVGVNEFFYALDNLPVTGPATVLPGLQHQLQICSSATIEVNAVRINFSN